jgi:hypothetical protein
MGAVRRQNLTDKLVIELRESWAIKVEVQAAVW